MSEPVPLGPDDDIAPPEPLLPWLARMLRELAALPATLRRARGFLQRECGADVLDAQLAAFCGYHQQPERRHYRMRPWLPVSPGEIDAEQVVGMPVSQFALVARMAMEIEDPIVAYSYQSGLGFRDLLPSLARFMGRDPESRAYAEASGLDWCDSAWCAEEHRHGNALHRILERLLPGRSVLRTNPSGAEDPLDTRAYALGHMDSRQATEWNAAAIYAALLTHAEGPLHRWLRNVFRDEVKHLAILSAADRYLRGPRPGRRLWGMLASILEQLRYHGAQRSGRGQAAQDPVFVLEILFTHVVVERRIRCWLRTLPHATLQRIFDQPSRLPEHSRGELPPREAEARAEERRRGEQEREQLSLWRPRERSAMFTYRELVERHRGTIDDVIERVFDGFRGAECPTSAAATRVRAHIARLSVRDLGGIPSAALPSVRRALVERLRDYQVDNNFETRAMRGERPLREDWFNPRLESLTA